MNFYRASSRGARFCCGDEMSVHLFFCPMPMLCLNEWTFWQSGSCFIVWGAPRTYSRPLANNSSTVSAYYAALLPRRGPHIASHSVCPSVCLSVYLSVRPVIVTERHVAPPSELQWHTCTFRHALRAAYRTAISAAQILVFVIFCRNAAA